VPRPVSGKQVLVIEDEYFIASDLTRALRDAGAHVVGPSGDVTRGIALVEGRTIDAAVLDINLEGADSYPIADALRARNIPFLFVTGYDDWALAQAYRAVPRISKPFSTRGVLDLLDTLIGEGAVA
jgi:CheY-like chemotaxis protein